MELNQIAVLTATFNEHTYTDYMIRSLRKQIPNSEQLHIYVLDNSDKTKFYNRGYKNTTVLDNTNYKHTKNYKQPSKNHCSSLDLALTQITEKYVMLVDNDILFRSNITELFDMLDENDVVGEIGWDVTPPDRLYPYVCLFNLDLIKSKEINMFNNFYCMRDDIPNPGKYDTGYWFLQEINTHKLKLKQIKISDYAVHLKGGTLRQYSPTQFLQKYRDMYERVAICAIAKMENKYMKYWVDHYLKLGVDHIFIYDNNDKTYPAVKNELIGYADKVTLYDVRERKYDFPDGKIQPGCYKHCYYTNRCDYDWIGFIDLDEYVELVKDNNIHDFLKRFDLNSIATVNLNWKVYGDNDLIHFAPISPVERFINPCPENIKSQSINRMENEHTKAFLNCHFNLTNSQEFNQIHNFITTSGRSVTASGESRSMQSPFQPIDYKTAYIKHFYTKTIEEFCERRFNCPRASCDMKFGKELLLDRFFKINKWTPEKEQVVRRYGAKYKDI